MSYDLSIRSDPFATLAVPTPRLQQLLTTVPGISSPDNVHFEIRTPRFGAYLRLIIDEIDEEGNSAEIVRRLEAGEPMDDDFVPERINEISVQAQWGLDPQTHRDGLTALWTLADQLGWRLLDHQEGRFIRPAYATQVFLPPQDTSDVHRRMALALKTAGALKASQTPATSTDQGRLHGFWPEWAVTLRFCSAPWASREAQFLAQPHGQTEPWSQLATYTSFIEFWSDFDDTGAHFNDWAGLCSALEHQFPGCIIIGPTGQPV